MDAVKMREDMKNMSLGQIIRKFISQNYLVADSDQIPDDESLLEKGIIDSTGVMELVAFIEGRFQIKIDDDEIIPENLDTISGIVQYINKKMDGRLHLEKGTDCNVVTTLS